MKKTLNEIETVSVLGAGAVGCFYGTKLQKSGLNVEYQSEFLAKQKVKQLKIKSIWGNYILPIRVFKMASQMKKSQLAIVSTKIIEIERDTNFIIENLKHIIDPKSVILLLQNGINIEEKIQKSFPENPVLGGLAFTCINRVSPSMIHHLDYGKVRIGSLKKKGAINAVRIVELFQKAGIDADHLHDLRAGRYEKLLWNVPFNSLSVVLQSKTDGLIIEDITAPIAKKLMREVYDIALRDGVNLPPNLPDIMIQRTIEMKPYKTSMLLDYEKGNPLEIETIIGEPLRIGKKYNLSTPYLEMMYYILKHIQLCITKKIMNK